MVTVHFAEQLPIRWLTELDALADKTAQVLATSLHRVLVDVAATVAKGFRHSGSPVWFFHILVGDGVNTNQAAAARLWHWIRTVPLPSPLRYFLVVVKCSNHQINLSLSSAVCGKSARLSLGCMGKFAHLSNAQREAECRQIGVINNVCGTIVRLFKYLVSDYYSQFCGNLHEVAGKLVVSEATAERQSNLRRWQDLQTLYGVGVIPDGLLQCLNGGLDDWSHCVAASSASSGVVGRAHETSSVSAAGSPAVSSAAQAPAGTEAIPAVFSCLSDVQDGLRQLLMRRLLCVDEHPTVTRMFTFKPHVEALLLMEFLGIVDGVLKLRGVQPQEQNRRRLSKVLGFMHSAETGQFLRRTTLALGLTDHVQRICAQTKHSTEPLLVRLAKGTVSRVVSSDFFRICSMMHLDSQLDVSSALVLLLSTAVDLSVRF